MIKPQQHDLSFYRGATDVRSITYQDSNNAAVDLTGYTATFTIRNAAGTVLATNGSGITCTITANTGTTVVTIGKAESKALPVGVHRYDFWLTPSATAEDPVLYGVFTVLEEVRSWA